MCRSFVNTVGNLAGAAWIDATEARGRGAASGAAK
jgi:hypothetical protein